jgi:hypothetical protein
LVLVTDGFTKTQHTIDYKYTIDKNDNCNIWFVIERSYKRSVYASALIFRSFIQ